MWKKVILMWVLNSHTSNWFYRTNRPYLGIFRQITWSDHIKDPRWNLILQLLAISASGLDLRMCIISAKIGSEPTVAGSILTDGNFFLVKNVMKENFFILASKFQTLGRSLTAIPHGSFCIINKLKFCGRWKTFQGGSRGENWLVWRGE